MYLLSQIDILGIYLKLQELYPIGSMYGIIPTFTIKINQSVGKYTEVALAKCICFFVLERISLSIQKLAQLPSPPILPCLTHWIIQIICVFQNASSAQKTSIFFVGVILSQNSIPRS